MKMLFVWLFLASKMLTQNRNTENSWYAYLFQPCDSESTGATWPAWQPTNYQLALSGGGVSYCSLHLSQYKFPLTQLKFNVHTTGKVTFPCWQSFFSNHGYFFGVFNTSHLVEQTVQQKLTGKIVTGKLNEKLACISCSNRSHIK